MREQKMVGDNKILTVSYGTFSCTLEGFEDPFNEMREIAEYFRDLAADDRYFGAEPPTPDPDRLQMIAQNDRRKPVLASVSKDGAVALTQVDEQPTSEQIPEVAPETAAPEPTISEEPAPAREPETPYVSAVGKLARLHAAEMADLDEAEEVGNQDFTFPETDSVAGSLRAAFRDDPADEPAPVEKPKPAKADRPGLDDLETIKDRPGLDDLAEINDRAPLTLEQDAPEPVAHHAAEQMEPAGADEEEMSQSPPSQSPSFMDSKEGAALLKRAPIDPDNGDGTADRIFDEADSQLEGTEARRKHSAIAHLKAAVSATVADRNILGWRTRQNAEEEVAYREDLAQAVRPTGNPISDFAAKVSDAPTLPPQAEAWDEDLSDEMDDGYDDDDDIEDIPLVLGTTERIGAFELASDAMVSPSSNENFSEFAEKVGAKGLGELLEAAAAYSGQIQGRPQFSRPQIMKHVSEVSSGDYSREDGLRSFGILLRQGKIQKLKRGVFVLSERSRFVEGSRLAGE